ncbi:hypothetical protein [Streptomyces sp. NPDC088358]|uniref:hypothetical protein n=1 Tax=Streptomyces sp. NPDC088358 TaxID=3365857 RepID=UPI003820A41E
MGPYRLTSPERTRLRALATTRQKCFLRNGIETTVRGTPSGRPVLIDANGVDGNANVPNECADGRLNTPTATEQRALDQLTRIARPCLDREHVGSAAFIAFGSTDRIMEPGFVFTKTASGGHDAERERKGKACVTEARREQLDPTVAPVAELFRCAH